MNEKYVISGLNNEQLELLAQAVFYRAKELNLDTKEIYRLGTVKGENVSKDYLERHGFTVTPVTPQGGLGLTDDERECFENMESAYIQVYGIDAKRDSIDTLAAKLRTAPAEDNDLKTANEQTDAAYFERNQVVAALAKCFPSGIAKTKIEGWADEWHNCVYIDLPTGQVSWHYHDREAHLFANLPAYTGVWDGHTTEQKYERLNALSAPTEGVVLRLEDADRLIELLRLIGTDLINISDKDYEDAERIKNLLGVSVAQLKASE